MTGAQEDLLRAPLVSDEEHGVQSVEKVLERSSACWPPDAWLWRWLHAVSFLIGGTTFLAGTVVLFYPGYDFMSALLYTIGSTGFLIVDLQEFWTYTEDPVLRTNILLSASGSFMYLVGSVGFFPAVVVYNPLIGVWGFVIGSAFIGWSQLWKTHRIGGGETPAGFSLKTLSQWDNFTAAGVELGAGIGAWCFFAGTLLYNQGPLDGPGSLLKLVLSIWVAGSAFFTAGGCFLAFRHFAMDVA